jgi:hypothetical protein
MTKDILGDLEHIFFVFDNQTANDTKAALLRVMNKLGNPMQWDPSKGFDAPAPAHLHAHEMHGPCPCMLCRFRRPLL